MSTPVDNIFLPDLMPVRVSRDEIMHVVSASFESSFAIPPQVLTGIPGVGKSDMAAQYAHDSKKAGKYAAIRWMQMDPTRVHNEWMALAYEMNIQLAGLSLTDIVRLVYRQLRQYRYLLIFDGVESFDSVQAYIPSDAQAGQHVLITSRAEVGWPYEIIVHRVEPFSPVESVSFVRKYCKIYGMESTFHETQALALHDTMEGLPQCLLVSMSCVAASRDSKNTLTISSFLDKYRQKQREGGRGLKVGSKFQSLHSLYELCVESLKQRQNCEASLRLLSQLSMLGSSDCASRSLLEALTGRSAIDPVVLPLMLFSFLFQVNSQSFRCPTSVQTSICAILLRLDMWTPDISRLPQFNETVLIEEGIRPLVDAMTGLLLTSKSDVPSVNEERSSFRAACDASGECNNILAIIEQLLKGDGINTGSRNELQKMKCVLKMCCASVASRGKQCKAALASLVALKGELSECYPNSDIMFGRLYFQTGMCHELMGKAGKAYESFRACLDIYTACLGETHVESAACLSHIGMAKFGMEEFMEARECYERVMIIQRSLYEDEMHPKIAQTLHDIAAVSLATGDHTEALLLYRESLSMKKRSHGTNHPEIALTLHQIGVLYEKDSKFTDASSQYDLCLTMKRKVYGDVHETVASELHGIGVVYKTQGKFSDALGSLQSSLVIKRKIYDENHIEIARSLHVIGTVYQEQGKHTLALEYFQGSMNMKALLSINTDDELLDTWLSIGAVYFSQGKYIEALKTFNECLDIQREMYPSRHPILVRTLLGIASVYDAQGKFLQSLSHYDEARMIQISAYGPADASVAHTLVKMAFVFKRQEKFDDSINTYEEALTILKSVHGENHAEVASVLTSIGNVFSAQGRYEDALMYLNHSLDIKRIVYDEHHQSVIHSEEIVRRIMKQSEFRNAMVQRFKEYTNSRQTESSSLGMSFSKEEKVAASEFMIKYLEDKGLERLNTLKASAEYAAHQGPLTDGRLGKLMNALFQEYFARESETVSPSRPRRGTIF
jgi:tetratricopeptide (TPR) repeat protein